MSWKATAFVKEIIEGITVYEKMVMFVLSDYHHTVSKAAWPSLRELAKESLMSESAVCRILNRLEEKNILRRMPGGGSGNRSKYLFIGLDTNTDQETGFHKPETLTGTLTQTLTGDARNTDPGDTAIRKERVEPVSALVNGETPPLPASALARGMVETIFLPITASNMRIVAAAIEAVLINRKCSTAEAHDWLMERVKEAQERGEAITKFWFEDGKYGQERRNGQSSKAQQRQTERRENITAAVRDRYSGHAGTSSSADGEGIDHSGDPGLVRVLRKRAGASD